MHVVTETDNKNIKEEIRNVLKDLGISHVTIEIETKEENCSCKNCKLEENNNKHHHNH